MRQPIASIGSSFRKTTPYTTCGRVHEGGDYRKRTIQYFKCGGSRHVRRDCPNLAQFGINTGRGGRTSSFGRSTGRDAGSIVSREGGTSAST